MQQVFMLINGLYDWEIQGQDLSMREDLTIVCGMIACELMKILARDDRDCISGHKTSNSSFHYTVV
jgi:hypothetical protein